MASLNNMPEVAEDVDAEASRGETHIQRLEQRVEALQKKQLDRAWGLLKEGQYMESRLAFKRARLGSEGATAAAIGEFISALADQQTRSAMVRLQSMIHHDPDMFGERVSLADVLPSKRDSERVIAECAARVTANPDSDEFAAMQVFLLWVDGDALSKQTAALSAAERLREKFRSSKYAAFLDMMRAELDSSHEELPIDDAAKG